MPETAIEIRVRFRFCREDDLEALEWMGLHTRDRNIIHGAFAAQQRDEALMLLAEAGGYPVGQAWIDFARRGSEDRPHIWAVRVFPPLQGAGLGERLMAEAETLAAGRGAREVELAVDPENPARRFYRRLGYRPVGVQREVVHHGVDNHWVETGLCQELMRKDLPAGDADAWPDGTRPRARGGEPR